MNKRTAFVYLLMLFAFSLLSFLTVLAEPENNPDLVCVIPIKGAIMDKGLPYFAKRAVDLAKQDKAKLIIFEINTPGGAVSIGDEEYTMGIVKAIENAAPITTVAYVANAAISAGVLISVSCDRIVMQPDATIGAAEPIAGSGTAENPHQAKYNSAFEAIMKAKAQKKGYPSNLVAAMVNRNLSVHYVKVNNQIDFLTEEEIKEARTQGKDVVEIKRIGKPQEPLTLTASEAKEYGLSQTIINTRKEIPPLFGINNFSEREMTPTWSEHLVIFITNPIVTSILILIGLISAGMALKAPGMGVPEGLAVICFVLVFFGHYLAGLAALTEVLLFLLGLGLLAVEIFFIPGFGVTGITGLILILVSLVLSMQDFTLPSPDLPWQWNIFKYNLSIILITTVLALILFIIFVRFVVPSTPYLERLVLKTAEKPADGFTSVAGDYQKFLGREGRVLSYLHPTGKIQVGEALLDVVTEGEFIEKGLKVKIIQIDGGRIVVAKV